MKNIIFLAGPHRSDSTEVNIFFHKHATSNEDNGLNGWLWPTINAELPGEEHQYFENFFWNHNNSTIQDVLMEGIQEGWNQSEYGIIVGAEGFDNTRGSLKSMGLKTMHSIIDSIGVPAQNVYVVMMYKPPRLDQWVDLFQHNSNQKEYEDFICNEPYSEHLANIDMNPLMLSTVYRAQGWNVATVDTSGAHTLGMDLGHSVACELLPMVVCDDGWIRNLQDETTEHEIVNLNEFDALSTDEQTELEDMFLERDCYYQSLLESDESFHVIHNKTLWSECETSGDARARYTQLAETEFFFDLMKAQVGCNKLRGQTITGPRDVDGDFIMGIQGSVDRNRDSKAIPALVGVMAAWLLMAYLVVTRSNRRAPHILRSPRKRPIIFPEESLYLSPPTEDNDDECSFSDIDLTSPSGIGRPVAISKLVSTARQGKSVRSIYEESIKGDDGLESEIKALEAELS